MRIKRPARWCLKSASEWGRRKRQRPDKLDHVGNNRPRLSRRAEARGACDFWYEPSVATFVASLENAQFSQSKTAELRSAGHPRAAVPTQSKIAQFLFSPYHPVSGYCQEHSRTEAAIGV